VGEDRGSKETDGCPLTHLVNSFRTWIYYPTVPFPQSVTDTLMETDREGDGGGRRGNPKERMPEKGMKPTE
jgi:hypothetical protein